MPGNDQQNAAGFESKESRELDRAWITAQEILALIRRFPSSWTSSSETRPLLGRERKSRSASFASPRMPCPKHFELPFTSARIAQNSERTRPWIERADFALDQDSWLIPINPAIFAAELWSIGCSRTYPEAGAVRSVLELVRALRPVLPERFRRGGRGRASGLGRANRDRFFEQDVAGVGPFIHIHHRDSGLAVPATIAAWIGAAPRCFGRREACRFRQAFVGISKTDRGRICP